MRGRTIVFLTLLVSALVAHASDDVPTKVAVEIAEEAIGLYRMPATARLVTTVNAYTLAQSRRHVRVKAFDDDRLMLEIDVIVNHGHLKFLSADGMLLHKDAGGSTLEVRSRVIDFLERRSGNRFERASLSTHKGAQRLIFLDPSSDIDGLRETYAELTKESNLLLFGRPE